MVDAPIQDVRSSYPGTPLRVGSSGPAVSVIQTELNRVGQNYPAIPKITPVDGVFGPQTENAVRRFQEIFDLTADGVVGRATWYRLVYLYGGILGLSELVSQGQQFFGVAYPLERVAEEMGAEGVLVVQYFLSVLSEFNPLIPPLTVDGIYGVETERAVTAFQTSQGLAPTGQVDETTWNALYNAYEGIDVTVLSQEVLFPAELQGLGNAPEVFELSTRLTQYPGRELRLGDRDVERRDS